MTIETLQSDYHFSKRGLKKMKKLTICRHCKFPKWKSSKHTGAIGAQTLTRICTSPDAPTHDFVEGLSLCDRLNQAGACKFFQPTKEEDDGR